MVLVRQNALSVSEWDRITRASIYDIDDEEPEVPGLDGIDDEEPMVPGLLIESLDGKKWRYQRVYTSDYTYTLEWVLA